MQHTTIISEEQQDVLHGEGYLKIDEVMLISSIFHEFAKIRVCHMSYLKSSISLMNSCFLSIYVKIVIKYPSRGLNMHTLTLNFLGKKVASVLEVKNFPSTLYLRSSCIDLILLTPFPN